MSRELLTLRNGFTLILLSLFTLSRAQTDEPLLESLASLIKHESFQVKALVQTVADFQSERSFEGENGFTLTASRLLLFGELDKGFSYLFQYDFATPSILLDAKLRYSAHPAFIVDAGVYKAPFSREFLTYAADIDFINRSQVVNALALKRQIGVQLRLFNGNGMSRTGNDNGDLMTVGRLALHPNLLANRGEGDGLEIAVDCARSRDDGVKLAGYDGGFRGERELLGADFRLVHNGLLLAGEYIMAGLEPAGSEKTETSGYQATAGYFIAPKTQLLLRWDRYSENGSGSDSDLLILGFNYFPTSPTELQVNYIVPGGKGPKNHQLLINFQLSI